jgi:sugar/nucleoside kinase (ribokinase family)
MALKRAFRRQVTVADTVGAGDTFLATAGLAARTGSSSTGRACAHFEASGCLSMPPERRRSTAAQAQTRYKPKEKQR